VSDPNEKEAADRRKLEALREYKALHARWYNALLEQRLRTQRLEMGKSVSADLPTNPEPLRQKLAVLEEDIRRILVFEELYAPIVRVRADGGESRTDPFAAAFLDDDSIEDFLKLLDTAVTRIRTRLGDPLDKLDAIRKELRASAAVEEIDTSDLAKRVSALEARPPREPWTRAHKLTVAGLVFGGITLTIVLLRLILAEGIADTKAQLNERMRRLEERLAATEEKLRKLPPAPSTHP